MSLPCVLTCCIGAFNCKTWRASNCSLGWQGRRGPGFVLEMDFLQFFFDKSGKICLLFQNKRHCLHHARVEHMKFEGICQIKEDVAFWSVGIAIFDHRHCYLHNSNNFFWQWIRSSQKALPFLWHPLTCNAFFKKRMTSFRLGRHCLLIEI